MALENMYPASNTLVVQLIADISASAQEIAVTDATAFPAAPNFATIGTDNSAEVILYQGIDVGNNALTGCLRGQSETSPQTWGTGAFIYHSFTSTNANAIMNNIRANNTALGTHNVDADAHNDIRTELANKASLAAEQIANRVYPGVDLAVKFTSEISSFATVWDWIKARIQAANFDGINVGDYIPFTAGGNTIKAEVSGIDTYYNYGDTAVSHHIDFISRDCWPDTIQWNLVNYNNGTTVSPSPWLASNLYAKLNSLAMSVPNATTANPELLAVDYSVTGVYDKLPAALKAAIVTKRLLLPSRYTSGALLTDDNSWAWKDAGKLWIPSEVEVCGMEHFGSKNGFSSGSFQQYPIFATNMKRVKGAGDGGSRSHWWLLSANGGGSTYCATVDGNGNASYGTAGSAGVRVPVCFRIA